MLSCFACFTMLSKCWGAFENGGKPRSQKGSPWPATIAQPILERTLAVLAEVNVGIVDIAGQNCCSIVLNSRYVLS